MRAPVLVRVVMLVVALPMWGQSGVPAAPADGGASEVLQSIFVPPAPDAPFTLTLATEWVQPLGTDGNTVTIVNRRKIARDREGRIYQERVLLRPVAVTGPWVTNWIQITDPTTHTWLNCSVFTKVCHVLPYNETTAEPNLTAGTEKLDGGTEERQLLGRDVMLGVDVVGVHTTTVIDAGRFGNSKPLRVVREFWYSPALHLNLRSMRDDPRSGRQTFTVTELSQDVPDPALWGVPAGFTVVDDKAAAKE